MAEGFIQSASVYDLRKDPFIKVPRLSGKDLVTGAIRAWQDFCRLDQETKEAFGFEVFDTKYGDPGYRRRSATDRKELFHLPVGVRHLIYNQGLYRLYRREPGVREFVDCGLALHEALREHLVRHVLYPGDLIDFEHWLDLSVLRFLRYDVKDPGDEVADAHFDYSWATCHVFASHPRLQGLVDGQWVDIETTNPRWMPFFAGYQMWEWTGGAMPPRIHRVLQESEGTRWSIVLFIPSALHDRFPKGENQQEWCRERGLDWFDVAA